MVPCLSSSLPRMTNSGIFLSSFWWLFLTSNEIWLSETKIQWILILSQGRDVSFLMKLERLRNENEDKTKKQMKQLFNQCSENETKIWRQSILHQFNRKSLSCLRSNFIIPLLS